MCRYVDCHCKVAIVLLRLKAIESEPPPPTSLPIDSCVHTFTGSPASHHGSLSPHLLGGGASGSSSCRSSQQSAGVVGQQGQMDGGLGPLAWSTADGCFAPQRRKKKTKKNSTCEIPVRRSLQQQRKKKKTACNHLNFLEEVGRKQAATGMVRTPVMPRKNPLQPHLKNSSFYNHWCAHTHTCPLYLQFYVDIFSIS